jgi:molecular chaperone DnaK (HSP70)
MPAPRPQGSPRRIAGLEVKRIINEPTAAALAFGMDDMWVWVAKEQEDRRL